MVVSKRELISLFNRKQVDPCYKKNISKVAFNTYLHTSLEQLFKSVMGEVVTKSESEKEKVITSQVAYAYRLNCCSA